ncbi:unnamed protein product [Brassica oleracea var. botrytis]
MERTFAPDKKQLSKCTNQPTNLYLGFFEMFTQQLTIIRLDRNLFKAHSRRLNLKRESPCSTDFLETWQHGIGRWKRRRDGRIGSFAFRKLKSQNPKRRARWRRSEASNRRSILSKRKRGPDLLTPPASSLFHWSLRRRNREVAASNREVAASKSQSTSVRFRSCTQASFLSKSSANRPNLVKNRWIEDDIRRRRAKHTTKRSDKAYSKSATGSFNQTKPNQTPQPELLIGQSRKLKI